MAWFMNNKAIVDDSSFIDFLLKQGALFTEVGVVNCLTIPRSRNLVAHTLASEAFTSGNEVVWLGVSPACVSSLL
ncbi:hypothetical protein Q3G72_025321 [Acer saccharum]|nr:hypothetical protein Q3G72_025321 [Acer saccharum]